MRWRLFYIGNDWDDILKEEVSKDYYLSLREFLKKEYEIKVIYPNIEDLFSCLKYTCYNNVKVVVLGQDPYHGANQADGLCFSVKKGMACPPSLVNIFKEIKHDIGKDLPICGDLTRWAKQGVLLLNAVLTVREGMPNSHKGVGWERFTDTVIKALNKREKPIAFLLWGNNARKKSELITNKNHLVLQCTHPSPLSAYHGFFGCKHFSKVNKFLIDNSQGEIDW